MALLPLRTPSEAQAVDSTSAAEAGLSAGLIGLWLPEPNGFLGQGPYADSIAAKTGTPALTGGPQNMPAWQFASGQYFDSAATVRAPALAGEFSWAGWVKFATTPVAYGMILTREAGGGTALEISTDGSGGTAKKPYFIAGGAIGAAASTVGADEWHLWHTSTNGASLQWYLDGKPDYDGTVVNTITAAGAWHINRRVSGTYAGNHALGPMAAWRRTTTAAEARQLYEDMLGAILAPRRIWVPVSAGGGSDIDITGIVGNATAAGITGAPAVSIDIAGSVASAVAAGITGSAQVATEIAGAVGNATAAGITGSAQVAVEIAGSVGNAVAEGVAGSTSVTNDINIDGVVGNAVAAGVAGDTSVGSDISISGTVGNAVAAGTTGVPGVSTTIAAAVGNATAAGVSGLAAIGVLIDGSVGNAAAAGITGTLTLDIVVAGVVANAVAAGVTGSASVETAAVSATPGYTIAAKARRLTITAAARRLEIRK